jgi:hypothetical protein
MKNLMLIAASLLFSISISQAQTNLKPADYQSVAAVLAQWNQLQDDGNLNGFMNLWAASPSFTNPFGAFKSYEEIKAFETNYLNGFAKGKRHLSSNVFITSKAKNTASASVDLMVVEVKEIHTSRQRFEPTWNW